MKAINLKKLSIAAAVLGLAVGGTTMVASNYVNASNSSAQVTKNSADTSKIKITQQQAIKKFTAKYGNKSIESIELEEHRGTYAYVIEGFDSSKEYIVAVDAETGKVLSSRSKSVDKDDKNVALDLTKLISRDEATEIAKKSASGTAVEWSLETEDGKAVWSVELVDGSNRSKVEIDAESKKVLSTKKDELKDRGFNYGGRKARGERYTSVSSNVIKATEAIEIAQKNASGTVVGSKLEKEDGKWIWSVELLNNSTETEVEIDATTKKVLNVEKDTDHDDSHDEDDD